MAEYRWERFLFRLYINWAVSLLIILGVSFTRKTNDYSAAARGNLQESARLSDYASFLDRRAEDLRDGAWCEKRALALEAKADGGSGLEGRDPIGGTPADLRRRDWCVGKAVELTTLSARLRVNAGDLRARANEMTRADSGKLLQRLFWLWLAAALLPWGKRRTDKGEGYDSNAQVGC